MTSIDTIVRVRSGSRWLGGSPAAVALLALVAACSSSSSGAGRRHGGASPAVTDGARASTQCARRPPLRATCASPGGPVRAPTTSIASSAASRRCRPTGTCVGRARCGRARAAGTTRSGGDDAARRGGRRAARPSTRQTTANCGETGYGVTNYGNERGGRRLQVRRLVDVDAGLRERERLLHRDREEARGRRRGALALRRAAADRRLRRRRGRITDDCATIAPNSGQTTVEQGNGVYKVGPIQFSKSGKWIVRFHFNECCSDDPMDSPHGHAAFWVNVP